MTTLLIPLLLLQHGKFKAPPNVKPDDKRYAWGNSNDAHVSVNGSRLPDRAVIRDNRVLVPMTPIFKALGVPFQWFPEPRKIVVQQGNRMVSLIVGENFAYNPEPVLLDYPPRVINGRVMVPLRFVSETLGGTVSWDQSTKVASVRISKAVVN